MLTIPAYGEQRELRNALASIPAGPRGDVLTVLVVNGRADSLQSVRDANLAAIEELRAGGGRGIAVGRHAELLEHPRGALLLVDRASRGRELPSGQGVGLARKLAADIALALCSEGRVASPWIHCTDADVALPARYFDATAAGAVDDSDAALLYPFHHVDAPREAVEYEIALRYYVAGLQFAGSPYAFHTVGSTLAVHASAYARVRGFPKRLAGEDFYLLNKLAKLGAIHSLDVEPIRISARNSNRTPFGTGRAIERAQAGKPAPRRVYHPDAFSDLGAWLQTLDALAACGDTAEPADLLAKRAPNWPRADAGRLRAHLEQTGAWAAARANAQRGKSPRTRAMHLHGGFDAFQALKLIHALRAGALASIPLREALAAAPFSRARDGTPVKRVCAAFAAAERARSRFGVPARALQF